LLQAAAEFAGGEEQLALRLDISPSLLGRLIAGLHHVPDTVLFRAVDIVLAHRQSIIPLGALAASRAGGDSA
jgi:hypothetical protein